MDYYSARLLFIILVGAPRASRRHDYDESVVVFRARSYDAAFRRALALGRAKEGSYKNHQGETVRWALVAVETLDRVGRVLDGKEVASKLHARLSKLPISPRKSFHPEKSKPSNSI